MKHIDIPQVAQVGFLITIIIKPLDYTLYSVYSMTVHGRYTESLKISPGSVTFDHVFLEIVLRALLDFEDTYLHD